MALNILNDRSSISLLFLSLIVSTKLLLSIGTVFWIKALLIPLTNRKIRRFSVMDFKLAVTFFLGSSTPVTKAKMNLMMPTTVNKATLKSSPGFRTLFLTFSMETWLSSHLMVWRQRMRMSCTIILGAYSLFSYHLLRFFKISYKLNYCSPRSRSTKPTKQT